MKYKYCGIYGEKKEEEEEEKKIYLHFGLDGDGDPALSVVDEDGESIAQLFYIAAHSIRRYGNISPDIAEALNFHLDAEGRIKIFQ